MPLEIMDDRQKLVELAISGNKESLDRLAVVVQAPLRSYVQRIIFREQLVEDIVQESLLEMLQIIGQVKQTEHFWPWLCKIALNKIRCHSRTENRRQDLLREQAPVLAAKAPNQDGLAAAVYNEFKACILTALGQLNERQKTILSLRCYEKMSYQEIAEVTGLSQLACRLHFTRARKKLQGQLLRSGYGKGSLILALVLFGKLTSASEAAAAQISLAPSLLSAGALATGITLLTSKLVLALAAVLGLIAGGYSVMKYQTTPSLQTPQSENRAANASQHAPANYHIAEGYYFYPQGRQGPVMTRLMIHQGDGRLQKLQNDTGNYSYDPARQAVTIENFHYWRPDLSVLSLPGDPRELEAFLARVENRSPLPHSLRGDSANLFIAVPGPGGQTSSFVAGNYEALLEERFQYNWPSQVGVQENRDELHKLGWCWFKLQGQIRGHSLSGTGRLPLTYAQAREKPAWLKLIWADKAILVEDPAASMKLDMFHRPVAAYAPGTFLKGLNRPWHGLHVIDTVRRDAALAQIPFASRLEAGTGIVTLAMARGKIEYRIEMDQDLIRTIRFHDSNNNVVGEVAFEYLSPALVGKETFPPPQLPGGWVTQEAGFAHWLAALLEDKL